MMDVLSHTEYRCTCTDFYNLRTSFKIRIGNQTKDRMAVTILEPTFFTTFKDYYKWYFKEDFFKVFTLTLPK